MLCSLAKSTAFTNDLIFNTVLSIMDVKVENVYECGSSVIDIFEREGKIYFKTDSNIEGSDECIFQVTSGAPKLTEGNFAENEVFARNLR